MNTSISVLLLALILPFSTYAQSNTSDTASVIQVQKHLSLTDSVSAKSLRFVDKKYTGLTNTVDSQTVRMLQRMQRKEAKLQRKLQGIDSSKAQQLFNGTQAQYQQLQAKLQAPFNSTAAERIKQYIPNVDSIGTVMHFLSGNSALPADKLAQIQNISSQVQQLQGRLQQANEVQAFIQQREQQLKSHLGQYSGLSGSLLGINKTAYYYQTQLAQYKELANDPEKLGQAILAQVRQMPAFQSFWQKNSMLAQLFPMPSNTGDPNVAVAGLQTRSQIQSMVSQRIPLPGGAGADPSQYMQQQLGQGQSQLNTLQDKLSQLGGGASNGSSSMTMPNFIPNSQRTKSFLKRLEYGVNFQTSPATSTLPAISNIGLMLGYKISDKATAGIGVSYQLGMGSGFNHIALTNQGVGLRSYVDIKAKGSIWITSGYEYNYMQAFAKFSDLRNINVWQKSALLGITKKYKVGNKNGNVQLLYDFLAATEVPAGRPIKFRIGYTF